MSDDDSTGDEKFLGWPERECTEHRTTGGRAWCYDCSQWCYPDEPCRGCEIPLLRKEILKLDAMLYEEGILPE